MQVLAQKSSKKESKLDQNSNANLASKSADRHLASANRHFLNADWPKSSAWPGDPLIEIKPVFFRFLEIRTCSNSYLISFSLSILTSINRGKKIKIKGSSFLTFLFPLCYRCSSGFCFRNFFFVSK